jgi:hypothetical protein
MADRDQPIERANGLLLSLVCLIVFMVPLLPPGWHDRLYNVLLSAIFFAAVTAVKRHRRPMFVAAGIALVIEWVASAAHLPVVTAAGRVFYVLFFGVIVLGLIRQVARTRRVSRAVILESINAYILLGFAFSLVVAVIMIYHPEAYSFPPPDTAAGHSFSQFVYYAFVTFTTLGYGDVVPLVPYTKSLAILTAIAGQLYVAVIIALLVGKYAGGAAEE